MAEEAARKAVWITTMSDMVKPQRLDCHFANVLNMPSLNSSWQDILSIHMVGMVVVLEIVIEFALTKILTRMCFRASRAL